MNYEAVNLNISSLYILLMNPSHDPNRLPTTSPTDVSIPFQISITTDKSLAILLIPMTKYSLGIVTRSQHPTFPLQRVPESTSPNGLEIIEFSFSFGIRRPIPPTPPAVHNIRFVNGTRLRHVNPESDLQ
jgi:hypothetical protein